MNTHEQRENGAHQPDRLSELNQLIARTQHELDAYQAERAELIAQSSEFDELRAAMTRPSHQVTSEYRVERVIGRLKEINQNVIDGQEVPIAIVGSLTVNTYPFHDVELYGPIIPRKTAYSFGTLASPITARKPDSQKYFDDPEIDKEMMLHFTLADIQGTGVHSSLVRNIQDRYVTTPLLQEAQSIKIITNQHELENSIEEVQSGNVLNVSHQDRVAKKLRDDELPIPRLIAAGEEGVTAVLHYIYSHIEKAHVASASNFTKTNTLACAINMGLNPHSIVKPQSHYEWSSVITDLKDATIRSFKDLAKDFLVAAYYEFNNHEEKSSGLNVPVFSSHFVAEVIKLDEDDLIVAARQAVKDLAIFKDSKQVENNKSISYRALPSSLAEQAIGEAFQIYGFHEPYTMDKLTSGEFKHIARQQDVTKKSRSLWQHITGR